MKTIFNVDYLVNNLSYILEVGKNYYLSDEGAKFLESIIRYLLSTTEITTKTIINNIKKISKKGGKIAMTTAAKLIKQGRIEGLEKGLEQKAIETAKKMKKDGLSTDRIALYTGLSEEKIKRL